MTTARESEILTRVGPGTPMGNLMRHYWLPAAKSSELIADGEPMRLKLLGEELIAFRDSAGRIGVMDHRCPHRCASLFFGRNEEGGIRCVYHGWKFDADGNCTDMANVPAHQDFKHKVHAKVYKAAERNGLVWVYMGERAEAPPLPLIESTLEPEADLEIDFIQRDCNWLQALEGDIDTSHLGFLHLGAAQAQSYANNNINQNIVANRAPEYVVEDTPFGTTYGAHRPSEDGGTYWRFAHFMFPCWTLPPISLFEINVLARAWVPLDDTHTMFILIANKNARKRRPSETFANGQSPAGTDAKDKYLPRTTDWLGRWKLAAHSGNDYLIDREVQRTQSYTGIDGIHLQDQAITESMGPITDHTFEHLAPSDIPIARTRRRILAAAQALAEKGTLPPGVDTPEDYRLQRGGSFVADAALGWREAYQQRIAQDVVPRAAKVAAE
jgi:phthalate 4,5-dioxygenase oxygenase subunit